MKCENFCNAHCSFDCPNTDAEYFEDKYGIPASDGGYEHVECKDCVYADKHCTCDDCYFKGGKECPEYNDAVELHKVSSRPKSEQYVCISCGKFCYYPHCKQGIQYRFCPNCGKRVRGYA